MSGDVLRNSNYANTSILIFRSAFNTTTTESFFRTNIEEVVHQNQPEVTGSDEINPNWPQIATHNRNRIDLDKPARLRFVIICQSQPK